MESVLCASYRINGKVRVEVFDPQVKSLEWVDKAAKLMKTPDGEDLKLCTFHSGWPGDHKDSSDANLCVHYAEKVECRPHSIWMKGGNCYDTCHILETRYKAAVDKENRICIKILETYATRETNVMKSHKEFFMNLDYLKTMRESIPRIEKEIEARMKPVNRIHPVYKTLEQLRDMAENLVKQKMIPHRRVYDNSNKSISFEEYLKNNCPEVEALERANEKLENWVNAHTPPPPADLITEKQKTLEKIESIATMLDKMWKLPYAMIYMLRDDIQRAIYSFGNEKEMWGYNREDLQYDIKYLDNYLGNYHSYMKGKKPIDIVNEVEKEQNRAIRIEKELKDVKSIQKIESNSAFVPVMCLDGTVSMQSMADTYIAGVTAGTVPNENWRAVSRLGTGKFEPLKVQEDDSKWERIRK